MLLLGSLLSYAGKEYLFELYQKAISSLSAKQLLDLLIPSFFVNLLLTVLALKLFRDKGREKITAFGVLWDQDQNAYCSNCEKPFPDYAAYEPLTKRKCFRCQSCKINYPLRTKRGDIIDLPDAVDSLENGKEAQDWSMKILWVLLIILSIALSFNAYSDEIDKQSLVGEIQNKTNTANSGSKNKPERRPSPIINKANPSNQEENSRNPDQNVGGSREKADFVSHQGVKKTAELLSDTPINTEIAESAKNATWLASWLLLLTLIVTAVAVTYSKKSQQAIVLQLQPWVVIKKTKVTLKPDIKLRDEFANLIVEFKIINEGKTPITAAHIDLDMVNVTAIIVGPFDMGESLITLRGGLVSGTTFQPINQGESGKIKIIVPCKRTSGDVNAVSFLYGGQLFYDIRASVKIRDSFTRKGRCRFFYIRSSREKGVMSEGRYESRKRHIVTSEFATSDSGAFNID